jgi:hypothetical protein
MSLYDELDDSLAECPLSHNKFLPLNILNDVITVEKVRANTGANTGSAVKTHTSSSNHSRAEDVVREAKRVFAILVLIGCENAIENLLLEGLTDEQLPLSRRGSGPDRNVLSGAVGNKKFETFRGWKQANVDHFLEKQWRVQAPVFDTTGSHFILHRECALPLKPQFEQIGRTTFSRVFKCILYPAHYQPASEVSVTSNPPWS